MKIRILFLASNEGLWESDPSVLICCHFHNQMEVSADHWVVCIGLWRQFTHLMCCGAHHVEPASKHLDQTSPFHFHPQTWVSDQQTLVTDRWESRQCQGHSYITTMSSPQNIAEWMTKLALFGRQESHVIGGKLGFTSVLAKMRPALSCTVRMQSQVSDPRLH